MSEPISASGHAHEVKSLDWQSLVDSMTDVQRLVHLAARHTEDHVRVRRETMIRATRDVYGEAIRQEVIHIGCPDPGRVYLREGAELRRMAEHINEVASGIENTYNYDLARAILQIGAETPTANRWVYAYRLNGWEAERMAAKEPFIAETEYGWTVNAAKEAFWANNAQIRAAAEVVPYPTVCPICAEYVAGNPYPSMEALYRRCSLPAHPRCPHHGSPLLDRRLTRDECRDLWIGG
ncbi:MAG: hypothetical protein WC683_12560 [bacterium]|jgi:hypothetical protein